MVIFVITLRKINFLLSFHFFLDIKPKSIAVVHVVLDAPDHCGLIVAFGPGKSNKLIGNVKNNVILAHHGRPKQNLIRLCVFVCRNAILLLIFFKVKILGWVPTEDLLIIVDIESKKINDGVAHQKLFVFAMPLFVKVEASDSFALRL
jgi:hypothetical protein